MISLPHALPAIFAGLKVSVTLAVVGAVVGEFVGSNSGIGYVLQIARRQFRPADRCSRRWSFCRSSALSCSAIVDLVERLLIPWHASAAPRDLATA